MVGTRGQNLVGTWSAHGRQAKPLRRNCFLKQITLLSESLEDRPMQKPELGKLGIISVVFETRPDGGLRVYSDDVPGFMLSHHDAEAVYKDVKPALETIISSMMKTPVTVVPVDRSRSFPWFPEKSRETREYETRVA
jgi:hypothetical protein